MPMEGAVSTAKSFIPLTLSVLALGLFALGCTADDDGSNLVVTVLDAKSEEPLPNALMVVEEGGIYIKNADPSKGSPAYQYGGRADAEGIFRLTLPAGDKGLHIFAAGHRYAPAKVTIEQSDVTTKEVLASPELPADQAPTISNVTIDPASASPGAQITLSATATAASAADPLSDETLAILAERAFSIALDPPSAGVQGVGFPDGLYTKTFAAPDAPGQYSYFVVATSEGCITSTPVSVTLTVQ